MKKYIKIILSILLFSTIFTVNAQTTEIEKENINNQDCTAIIVSILNNNSNNELKKIIRDTEKPYSERITSISKKLNPCLKNVVESDVALKILRMLYGEVINIPISVSSQQFLRALNIKSEFNEEKFNEGSDILSYLPEIIGTFNYIIFTFAVFFVGLIYGSKFFKMMSVKGQSTTQHFAKNNLRVILGLSSILPLAFINNFTFIQFLFLSLIILGVMIAKILWLLMLFSLNFVTIESDITNIVETSDIGTSFVNQINSNIIIHFCDLQKRNDFLEKDVLSDSYTDLKSSNYYNCLINPNQYPYKNEKNNGIYIPDQIKIGEFCAKKFEYISENEEYCGQIFTNEEQENNKIKSLAIKSLLVLTEDYQTKIRNLAYSFYKYECKLTAGDQKLESKKAFRCPKIKNDGSIEYNQELDKILFENESFLNQKQIDDFIKVEFPNKYVEINNDIENFIKNLSPALMNAEIMGDTIDSLISSYKKGFLMAGNIFYERAKISNSVISIMESLKDIYTIKTTEEFDLPNIGTINNAHIFLKLKRQGENAFIVPLTEIMDSKENSNCSLNYSDCYMSAINPFTKLMDNGNKMLSNGVGYLVATMGVKAVYNYFDLEFLMNNRNKTKQEKALLKREIESNKSTIAKNMKEYLDFLASIIFIYIFIGVFFAFILPFIPFFIFASLVFSWFVQTFKILLLSGLLSLYMLIPNEKNDGFAGKEDKIYKLFIKTALTPVLILCGFLITIVLANLGISILNIWFAIIIDYFSLKGNPENIMDYINSFIALGIYLFMVTKVVIKASESIAEFPVAVSKWLDIDIEDERVFNKIKGMFESYVVPSIGKFMK